MSEELPEEATTTAPEEGAVSGFAGLRRELDEVRRDLESVAETVAAVDAREALLPEEEPNEPQPVWWSWHHVTGEKRGELWQHLLGFVRWVNKRYFFDKPNEAIASCWFQHGMVVEELTGVWAAWHAALHGAKEPTNDYAAWHRYYFWPAMERITQVTKDCRGLKGHEEIVPRPVPTHPGLEDFMDADCAAHPDPEETAGESVDPATGEILPG